MRYLLLLAVLMIFHGAGAENAPPRPNLRSEDQNGNVISRVSGTLDDTVITSRDVKISHMVELAFKKKPFQKVNESSAQFHNLVSEALLEWMVYLESEAIKSDEPSLTEKQKLEQDLNSLIRSSESAANFWKKLEVTGEEKRQFINRKIQSKKLLQFRTQSSLVTVTDRDALTYYQRNRSKFGNSPFEKLKENIKTFLEQQNAEARLKDWLTILQKKYNVKHLGNT